jgi:hypothetical protein
MRKHYYYIRIISLALLYLIPVYGQTADWPGEGTNSGVQWLNYTLANGQLVSDAQDVSPSVTDIFYSAQDGSSVKVASDGNNLFFRLQLRGNPGGGPGGFANSASYIVQMADASGTMKVSVGLDAKLSDDVVYVIDPSGSIQNDIYYYSFEGTLAMRSVNVPGTTNYYIDFQVPIAEISFIWPGFTSTTVAKYFYGTSTTNASINKDYMTGSFVDFSTVSLVTAANVAAGVLYSPRISGNAGVAGATLSYTDGSAKTATADGSGNYSFTVSNNWSGTVTPSKTSYSFSPSSISYSSLQADQTAQNYTASFGTFTVSGNAGTAGATLSYTDGSAKTATADGSGNYSFTVSYNWSGTVTPSLTGYSFSPANKVYSNVLSNQSTQNYTATAVTYTISGNAGIAGATLSYTDGSAKTATADGSGNYSFTVSYNWSGTVTPSLTGYNFSPANKVYSNVLSNQSTQNYTATAVTYTISGNAGIAGATLSYTDGSAKTATADGSGNYSFTVSYNWSGTVTPSLTGYSFSPANKVYSNILSNQSSQDYTSTAVTYTISGNAGIAGATLSYTDGSAKTATADGSGNYSFSVSYNWSGTVTPSLTGYSFSPANKVYSNVLSNQSSQDYTSTAVTYTISGNAGIAGATLSYTDSSAKTATADGSGNYSFTVSYNWSGTVTPSLTGYSFSPANKVYSNVLSNQSTQDYTATAVTYTISGNAGIAGATLSYTDGSAKTATADGSGNYSFTVSYNWSGTVTPSLTGYSFSPANKVYSNVLSNQSTQNYTATAVTYTISGNAGIAGATLSYTDGSAKTATADGSGNYSFTVSYNWSGTVTPSLTGYSFSPANKVYSNVLSNQSTQNYTATAVTYAISGNAGIAGAILSYTDGSAKTATADGSGNYSFTVSYNWSGTVTPSLTGYSFSPANKVYSNVLANQSTQNYTATAVTYTITGNAGIAGVTLSYTDGSAKTATADGSGNYSFTVSYNWSGTVTPSLTGYSFSPANKVYSNVLSNQSTQNYTATAVTYTISGNAGIAGATLSYTDGSAKTATADGSGNYSFTVTYGWNGTVQPSKQGYRFSPAEYSYAGVTSDEPNQNYSAEKITYTISGNTGTGNVSLKYTDGTEKIILSDDSGNYSFTVSYNWSGKVVPSKAGYTFSTVNKVYENILENKTGENYSAALQTYTISGNTGVKGATILYNINGEIKAVTSDETGKFSITVPYGWNGTLTPSRAGYTFVPAGIELKDIKQSQGQTNFTASEITYTISGNTGTGGVKLKYTDGTVKGITSDASGNYSLSVPYIWSGTVTAEKEGYTFTPSQRVYSGVEENKSNQHYTADLITITVSGNAGTGGVILNYVDGSPKTIAADGNGNYTITVPFNWSGTITPVKEGYTFAPVNMEYNALRESRGNQNYVSSEIMIIISGNTGTPGVHLSYTDGGLKTVVSDESGNYSLTVPYRWSGIVTPVKEGYVFTPAEREYKNIIENQTGQLYSSLLSVITITGNAGAAGVLLSYTDGTKKSVVSDNEGNYAVTVSYNWSGSITPVLEGYKFSPSQKSFNEIKENMQGQNFTATRLQIIISGNVSVPGAVITYRDSITKIADADEKGNYSFSVPYNWTGTVTPAKQGYDFTPAFRSYKEIKEEQPKQDYSSSVLALTISGNAGIPGVVLSYTDGTAKTAVSDETGNYSISVSYNWSGVIIPSHAGYTFLPEKNIYKNITESQAGQDYKPAVPRFIISGNTGTNNVELRYSEGGEKVVNSDSSGNYNISVPYNWSGGVSPVKAGFTFTPEIKNYSGVTANIIGDNFRADSAQIIITGNTGTGSVEIIYGEKSVKSDSLGNYEIKVSYNWSGTLVPVKAGYTFSPAVIEIKNITSNITGKDFAGTVVLLTISGNTGAAGVTITYKDGSDKTVISDSTGNYSLMVPYNWSGIIIPSKQGRSFTPEFREYKNIITSQEKQSFASTVQKYVISGNTGTAGVILNYTDSAEVSVVSDESGNYNITVPYNWGGTIIPSKAGYTFEPAVKTYKNITASVTGENYKASEILITIRGNAGVQGVEINYTDETAKKAVTDSSGAFILSIPYNWSGKLTPVKNGYIFVPEHVVYNKITENITKCNFVPQLKQLTIKGNTAVKEVLLSWENNGEKNVLSDAEGNYTIEVPFGWSGTVTLKKAGHFILPLKRTYNNMSSDLTGENYDVTLGKNPTGLTFTNLDSTSFRVKYSAAPTGGEYLVVRRIGNEPDFIPAQGHEYNEGVNGNNVIVYKGTGTEFLQTNVEINTDYFYEIFTYKGTGSNTCYLTESPLKGLNRLVLSENDSVITVPATTSVVSNEFPGMGVTIVFPSGSTGTSISVSKVVAPAAPDTAFKAEGGLSFVVKSTNTSPGEYVIVLDFSSLKVDNWDSCKVYKRDNATSSWSDISASGSHALIEERANDGIPGKFKISGLDKFGEFALKKTESLPADFSLMQNYPNPFNLSTKLYYTLPKECLVTISVFNILGEKVADLVNDSRESGKQTITWNAVNISSGVYIYRINASPVDGSGKFSKVMKMVLLK